MTARRRARAIASLLTVTVLASATAQAGSIRFFGNGVNDIDRVKIPIDNPAQPNDVGPPADVGVTDFTIEFWIKGALADNNNGQIRCGNEYGWINGHTIFDRDRFNQPRAFGISLGGGRVAFGANVANNIWTICGATNVLDGAWHHVAVTRTLGGQMRLFVDGLQDGGQATTNNGPTGNISYPDDGVPQNACSGSCDRSDPFIVLGAEKHDANQFNAPSFDGFMDELRLSTTVRYSGTFARPAAPFVVDANTAALYHFDEGSAGNCTTGTVITDSAGAASPGVCRFGGTPGGPAFSADSPFAAAADSLQFSAANSAATEGTGTPNVTLSVTRTGGNTGAVSAAYATADGTALANNDYTPVTNGQVVWLAGDTATTKSFTIAITDDALLEPPPGETFTVTLSAPTGGATLGSPSTATVTIADNDAPGTLQLSAGSYATAEGSGARVITVTRLNGSAGAVSVDYATSDGTTGSPAMAPGDYTATNGTLMWAAGDAAAKTFNVPIVDDAVIDPNENFRVAITAPSGGATLGTPNTATVTIADNDSAGLFAFETTGFQVNEANGTAVITVNRTNGNIGAVSVNYASSNGVAMAPADYGAVSGTLNWIAGEGGPKTFTVSIVNDAAVEGNEPLNLQLSGATGGASVSPPGAATLTIVDDDVAQTGTLQLAQATFTVGENSGTLALTVSRINGADGAAQMTIASSNGTATAGTDFQLLSQTLSWAAGESVSKTATLTILNDAVDEPAESLTIDLIGVTGATLGTPASAIVTIDDDDPPLNSGGGGGGGGGATDFYLLLLGGFVLLLHQARRPGILRMRL